MSNAARGPRGRKRLKPPTREQGDADDDEHAQAGAVQRGEAEQRAGGHDGGREARAREAKRAANGTGSHADTVADDVAVVGTATPRPTAAST